MGLKTSWRVFVCPECGWAETKPWSECWHICDIPSVSVQVYDPSKERKDISWTSMVQVPRWRVRQLVDDGDPTRPLNYGGTT